MHYATSSAQVANSRVHALIIGIFEDGSLSPAAEAVDSATEGRIQAIIKRQDFKGKKAQTMLLQDLDGIKAPRVLMVGLGKAGDRSGCRQRDRGRARELRTLTGRDTG